MKLIIISPETQEEFEIAWIEVNTHAGNFIVLPDHAPMVATLTPKQKVIFCLANGKQETIKPEAGTVEVKRTTVTLLLNKAP